MNKEVLTFGDFKLEIISFTVMKVLFFQSM